MMASKVWSSEPVKNVQVYRSKCTFSFSTCREERGQFIRLKYRERKFAKEEEDDDVDPEVELACLKQNESDEEKLLLEESEEVRLF